MKKKFTAKMKLKIALEAIKGDMTIRELGARTGFHLLRFIVGNTNF